LRIKLNLLGKSYVRGCEIRRLRVAEGQVFEPLDVAKVSPFIFENHELVGVLLIPLFLPNSVVCEDLAHKISTRAGSRSYIEVR
jgi:hypothetical protein